MLDAVPADILHDNDGRPWVPVTGGGRLTVGNIRPEDINIRLIARGLSRIPRYGGQTRSFYSVADHSIYVAHHVPYEFFLHGLLHDASEAMGLMDLPRPIKHLPGMHAYRALHHQAQAAVCDKYCLWHKGSITVPEVDEVDKRICLNEVRDLMDGQEEWLALRMMSGLEPLPIRMRGSMAPADVELSFIENFHAWCESNGADFGEGII